MSNYSFETVTVPQGAFIGWHENPGQVVTGKVLSYDAAGGQDFNGGRCPQIVLELVEPASSFSKAGERSDFAAGEMVTITAGQANLKRGILAADPATGDVLRIVYARQERTANGTVKVFELAIARGAGGPVQAPATPTPAPAAAPAPVPFSPNPAPAQTQPVAPF